MNNKQWYVVYTAPRGEKKAAQRLLERGFDIFLPLQDTIRTWSDRKKKVQVPLFPSYLFVHIDIVRDRYPLLETEGVSRFVYYLGQPAEVRDSDIEAIRYMLKGFTDIEAVSLQPGQPVHITGGKLRGHSGIVRDIENGVLTLELQHIGYQLVARIPIEQIRV